MKAEIKMKPNYKIIYGSVCNDDEILIVDNYDNYNQIFIIGSYGVLNKVLTDNHTIGVWKVKTKNPIT